MQVRLTKEGQKILGFLPDRKIVIVSDERAFALMSGGYAIKDKGFMALFDAPLPKKEKPKIVPEPKPEKKEEQEVEKYQGKQKTKKEQAISKKAKKREKAVKK